MDTPFPTLPASLSADVTAGPRNAPVDDHAAAPLRIPAPPAPVPGCASCGVALAGRFCAQCGQRCMEGRLTLRGVALETVTSVVDVDRGLLHTAIGMTVRPGTVVRDWLAGRTVRYTGPARYFALLVALVVLVYVNVGATAGFTDAAGAGGKAEEVARFLQTHMNLLIAVNVPFSALATWVVYRRHGLNYAEHLVMNLYTNAHQSLLLIPFCAAGVAFGELPLLMAVYSLAGFAYLAWAARDTFQIGVGAAVLRTMGVQLMMMMTAGLTGVAGTLGYLLLTR